MEINDLPESLRPIAKALGIAAVKTLIVKCPGKTFYIPKSLNSSYNHNYIKENFTGDNYADLAEHLGITTRSVYRCLKVDIKKGPNPNESNGSHKPQKTLA